MSSRRCDGPPVGGHGSRDARCFLASGFLRIFPLLVDAEVELFKRMEDKRQPWVARMMLFLLCFAQRLVAAAFCMAPSGPWDAFNLSPKSKTVYPLSLHNVSGAISNAEGLVSNGSATFSGSGSYVTLDFSQEVSVAEMIREIKLNII